MNLIKIGTQQDPELVTMIALTKNDEHSVNVAFTRVAKKSQDAWSSSELKQSRIVLSLSFNDFVAALESAAQEKRIPDFTGANPPPLKL